MTLALCARTLSCVFPTPAVQFQRASVRFIYGEMFRVDRHQAHTHGFVAGQGSEPREAGLPRVKPQPIFEVFFGGQCSRKLHADVAAFYFFTVMENFGMA